MTDNFLILVIESNNKTQNEICGWLEDEWPGQILKANTGQDGIRLYTENLMNLGIVILNLKLSDMLGLEALGHLKRISKMPEIIMLTDNKDIVSAVEAMKRGAFDIIELPSFKAELQFTIEKAMQIEHILKKMENFHNQNGEISPENRLEAFQQIWAECKQKGLPLNEDQINKFFPSENSREQIYISKIQDDLIKNNSHISSTQPFEIMIVEDEAEMRKNIKTLLSLENYILHEAVDASNALDLLKKGIKPDLVILDIGLPGMTGDVLLREIRQIVPDVEAIMVTGIKDIELVVNTMKDGASEYITKPFDPVFLFSKISHALIKKHFKNMLPDYWRENVKKMFL